jgi:TRAP transporter TAXI family solute receptor
VALPRRGAAVSIDAAARGQTGTSEQAAGEQGVGRALVLFGAVFLLASAPGQAADAPPPIVVHAGKADSLNHALALQFAQAVAQGNIALTVQVEESQGSAQNIKDALHAGGLYVFTTAPYLIGQARRGDKPFEHSPGYRDIRALFPIPAQTLHWVVRADSDVKRLPDLAGRPFVPGAKGSFGERQTASVLHVLGLEQRVQLIDIDPAGAQAALAGNQVVGIALAGTFPMAAVNDLAKATPIRLLSLAREDLAKVLAADDSTVPGLIPKKTYPGQDEDIASVALPAGAYTTTEMSNQMAYAITKAFWSQKWALAQRNAPWSAVTPAALATLGVKLHKGALRYYREAGVKVPAALR